MLKSVLENSNGLLQWVRNKTQVARSYFRASAYFREQSISETNNAPEHDLVMGALIPVGADTTPNTLESAQSLSSFKVASCLCALMLSQENMPRITGAAMLTGVGTGLNFLFPYLLGETINLLTHDQETVTIAGIEVPRVGLLSLLVAVHALTQLVPNQRDQIMAPVTADNTKKLIIRSTDHLLKKSLDRHVNTPFFEHFYLIQKCFAVTSISTPVLTQIAPMIVEIAIASAVLTSRYGVGMGAGIIGLLAGYAGFGAVTAKSIIKVREQALKVGTATYEALSSTIMQYKAMYDFGKYDYAMCEINKIVSKMAEVEVRAVNKPLKISYGYIGLSHMHMLAAAVFVGAGVRSGKYSVQEFIVLVSYLGQLATLLPGFGQAVSQLFASYPDLKYVFGELATPDEVVDRHPNVPLIINGAPCIEFEDVSFVYAKKQGENEKPHVFKHFSFKIEPGQTVALVSESGAGKTTIFNLLYGYYQPSHGKIKINSQDIAEVSLKALQNQIVLMGQNPNLFKGTIRDNICYGAEHPTMVTDDDIWTLSRSANLYDFLQAFPEKLNTNVGENGKALSGGQQQKVAILRALLKKGSIRLLDEITAPFDSQSAAQILQSLSHSANGSTSLMITHKLTEVTGVDQIIVLDDGQVIAQGTHAVLLNTCPLYQQLWTSAINHNSPTRSPGTQSTLFGLAAQSSIGNSLPLVSSTPGELRTVESLDESPQHDFNV